MFLKSEIFLYFSKFTAAIWSINKIIPVSVALIQNEKGFDVEKNLEKITSTVSVMDSNISDIKMEDVLPPFILSKSNISHL